LSHIVWIFCRSGLSEEDFEGYI